jgi:hypothetical protein
VVPALTGLDARQVLVLVRAVRKSIREIQKLAKRKSLAGQPGAQILSDRKCS